MKTIRKNLKKTIQFAKQNYIVVIFCFIIFIVGCIVFFKLLTKKDETVYVKVKVSQGLWWANTAKPQYWLVNSLKKGDKEISVGGVPKGKIVSVRFYPWYETDQFNIYLLLELKADKNKKTGKYIYNRTTLAVGSPIDFEFTNTQVSATIMELSDQPINDDYVEKVVLLNKSLAESWEYDAIKIGDTFYDGEDVVFEVINKSVKDASEVYTRTNVEPILTTEKPVNIDVLAKMKFLNKGSLYFQEFPVQIGRKLDIRTNNYMYTQYYIKSLE